MLRMPSVFSVMSDHFFGRHAAAELFSFVSLTALSCTVEPPRRTTVAAGQSAAAVTDSFAINRAAMVLHQIRARGISAPAVLKAMRTVPRHEFVPLAARDVAYDDRPVEIGFQQTISQPYIVAYMTEAADISSSEKVLEIGTGSAYQAAVLAELASEVYSIEILPELAERARTLLRELGYAKVQVRTGDGYLGWKEHAPFDAILVTAAPDHVPPALVEQLAANGRMVIPVGTEEQELR